MLRQVSAPRARAGGAGVGQAAGTRNCFPDKQMTWKSQTKANTKEMEKMGERGWGEGMEKYASKRQMLHNNNNLATETIAMTEQMFSICPEASSDGKCSAPTGCQLWVYLLHIQLVQ